MKKTRKEIETDVGIIVTENYPVRHIRETLVEDVPQPRASRHAVKKYYKQVALYKEHVLAYRENKVQHDYIRAEFIYGSICRIYGKLPYVGRKYIESRGGLIGKEVL